MAKTIDDQIETLVNDLQAKLDEIAELSLLANESTSIYVNGHRFFVYIPEHLSEIRNQMFEDYGYQPGEWISSSELC